MSQVVARNLVQTPEREHEFRQKLQASKHLVIITGAGVSAESGIPTFRGAGGLWRNFDAMKLATPDAFHRDPSLVWQFYQYRRDIVAIKKPNNGHVAIAEVEKRFKQEGKKFTLITQNVDRYHLQAGSQNVIEMHGNLVETRCTKCKHTEENREVLVDASSSETLPNEKLPRCKVNNCGGLLRPNVVWFEESINPTVLENIYDAFETCDLFIIAGTSSVVMPAASFAYQLSSKGVPIAEFNIEEKSTSDVTKGKASELLPKYLLN